MHIQDVKWWMRGPARSGIGLAADDSEHPRPASPPSSSLARLNRSRSMELVVLELAQLADCPEHLPAVGTWIYNEWWSRAHDSPEVVFSLLRTHDVRDRVPLTVVALIDGTPVGSCSVIENDCVHRPQYAPWVAAVYVRPEHRRRGIASAILQEAAAIATRIGIHGLYIDCLATTAPVYERNGWAIHEREVGDKDSVVMLRHTRA